MLFLITILNSLTFIKSNYLAAENNFQRPSLERNNKINKGVWLRDNLKDQQFGQNYFVGSNSLDAEHVFQNNFDSFKPIGLEEIPVINTYVERNRRSAESKKRFPQKNIKSKNSIKNSIEDKINKRRSSESVKGYPLKITLLNRPNVKTEPTVIDLPVTELDNDNQTNLTENVTDKSYIEFKQAYNTEKATTKIENITQNNTDAPKRNKKYDYKIVNNETELERNRKHAESIFNSPEMIWHQKNSAHDSDIYEVVEPEKNKISERGLVKVITMLTKTFKKLSKQHTEIKLIHDKLINLNEDFCKKITDLNNKFKDFDSKYRYMIQFNDRIKQLDDKLTNELDYFKSKHKDMNNNIQEFENQQKKFLAQQRQFYTIQKLMIAQNEKINQKQNMISKTQSEISLKQNNFARILKKAKQLVIDAKIKNNTQSKEDPTTIKPIATTDIIKINLFSIPTKPKIENKDELLIKEKDYQPIDELVYKHYFNNTFLDNFMKEHILNYANTHANTRNMKTKREKFNTIMLPIKFKRNKRSFGNGLQKLKRKDAKKIDPFVEMATNFCNEIKQNSNKQVLNWCVEKALRRLRFMDKKLFSSPTVMKAQKPFKVATEPPTTKNTETPEKQTTQMYPVTVKRTVTDVFFPDNDELESKLAQYELTPDTEGNVYYDGSLHLSDIQHDKTKDSDSTSDIMPGLMESNSKVEMDTYAFDLQAKRRAFVRRLNENILRQYKIG